MHIAARTAWVLPLALVQLALPALAQTDSAPIVLPAETLPPEPEVPHPGANAPAPEPAVAPPDYQLTPPELPLSSQILQIHLSNGWSPLRVTRAGIEYPDLLLAVSGSELAASLIRSGQSQVSTGTILSISGLSIWVGTLLISIPVAAANPHPTDSQAAAMGAGIFIGVLVGVIVEVVGEMMRGGGYHDIIEGVNAYNADLLDGRLAPPAVTAVPPR